MTNIEQVNFELSQDNINVEVSIFGNTAEVRNANGDIYNPTWPQAHR